MLSEILTILAPLETVCDSPIIDYRLYFFSENNARLICMATDTQAAAYLTNVYQKVWQSYSSQALMRYYARDIDATTGEYNFSYEELHTLVNNPYSLSHMVPVFHNIKAHGSEMFTAWFTTLHYHHDGNEALRINTMGNYTIKDDKIVKIEFMWDQPIYRVMGYKSGDDSHSITNLLPQRLHKLSRRELQCLFYLIQGHSAKSIAKHFNLSPRTIESHIENIKLKTDLLNKRDLIGFAFANGLVALSPLFSLILQK